jgi:hypothetical protein
LRERKKTEMKKRRKKESQTKKKQRKTKEVSHAAVHIPLFWREKKR